MILRLKNSHVELQHSSIMGVVELNKDEPFDAEKVKNAAEAMIDCGAQFIEFGLDPQATSDQQKDYYSLALESVKELEIIPAVYTSLPEVMDVAVGAGAEIIVDPMALRVPGAAAMAAELDVPVVLCFDQEHVFNEEEDLDPCALVSDFFYERIDSCMNAGMHRSKIILDPMLGVNTSNEYRLKMQGRLKTLQSFGLSLSCEVPRGLPQVDEFLEKNLSSAVAVVLFMQKQGVNIIRTKYVEEFSLALDTWQALNYSARPFKLSRVFRKKLKALAHPHKVEE